MSWPMQSTGPWGMPVDINMGSYSADQWTAMQQQNWQQWAQWQQQYAQWQSQYGEKYAQQMQAMQSMGAMPPLPPTNEPPPAPPPPDQPPPLPHENNQPLYGTAPSQPTPVPPPTQSKPASTNLTSTNTGNNQWSYGTDAHAKTASPAPAQPDGDSEALKNLAEEEKLFDIQFQKWEDEIDKWRQENVNHPDKQAYKEYEDKFESCRAQLMERRQQMKLKRARLTNNAQPASAPMTGNASTAVPPPQHTPSNNYRQNKQQNYNNNQDTTRMNENSTYQNQQYNNKQYNNASQATPYGRGNDEAQDRFKSYQKMDDYSTNDNNYSNSYPSDNSSFLPASGAPKSIPGLDLVPETDRAPPKLDVIDITEEQEMANYNQYHQQRKGPDLSSISKGINSILGDEKIMNILSMVRGQATDSPAPQQTENMPYNNNQNYQNNQMNNQWNRNENDYNQQYGSRPNNMPYNNRQEPNYPMQQNKDQFRFLPPNQNRMYGERPPNMQNQYNNENSNYGRQDMPQMNQPPPVRLNAPPPKPLMDLPILMNNNFRGPPERCMPENVRPPSPPRPKWVEEPLFNPSLIVEYEHKPLRLKARDFIEPVHTFDYNHISKNNDKKKKDFEREADEVFLRKPRRDRDDDYESQDRYARDQYSRDFERRVPREDAREMRDDYRYKPSRNEHDDRRRPEDRYDERRRDDRFTRRDDNFTRRDDNFSRRDDNFPRRVDNFPKRDDNFSRRDDNFPKRDDNSARRDDNFPKRDDNSARRDDNFPKRDDNSARRDDNFPKRDDNFARRDDNFPRRDDNTPRREDNFTRRDDNIPRREDNFTRRDDNFPRREDSFTRREDSLRDRDRERERERDRDVHRDRLRERDFSRRDDERDIPPSRSRERDSRKREHSKESPPTDDSKKPKESSKSDPSKKPVVMIDDILESPGREHRPEKIVVILRGPPGSGKSYLAKLIRDREAENGGAARIMSIDDYFMQEGEVEEKDPTTGKMVKKPTLKYEYDAALEETYLNSLKRAFKRSLTDGYFTFLIYDAVNDHLKDYADVWNFARQHGFQVYICTMELDPQTCFKRNIHNRSLHDIEDLCSRFFDTPPHHIALDATTLLQSAAITHVHMEDADDHDVIMEDADTEVESVFTSKWEKMDDASQLAKLDGTSKPLRSSQLSMEDYLQLDDWTPSQARPGKKTVRWADIEERREQEKMRAIGFVVGQTDWNRMTDPTMGSSALTQTKYIERVRRT